MEQLEYRIKTPLAAVVMGLLSAASVGAQVVRIPIEGMPPIGRLPALAPDLQAIGPLGAPGLSVPLLSQSPLEPAPAPVSIEGVEVALPAFARVGDPRAENIGVWEAFWAQPPAQRRPEELLKALEASGGGPFQGGGRLVFVSREQGFVAGSFNDWRADGAPLVDIGGGLFAAEVRLPGARRVAYKFVSGGIWRSDPLARWVEWDGIGTGGVGGFNSVAFSGRAAKLKASELYRMPAFVSSALGNARDVFVQVPDAYIKNPSPLPLAIFHDGNESLTRGRFDYGLDAARAAGRLPPALVAYVALHDQNERMGDYTSSSGRYEGYLIEELLPRLEAAFSTPRTPETRIIGGASLGGLISYRIALNRPDVFGRALSQSGTFGWNEGALIAEVAARKTLPGRWYLDAGGDELDNGVVAERMRRALAGAGADVRYVRDPAGRHAWGDWAKRLPEALASLLR